MRFWKEWVAGNELKRLSLIKRLVKINRLHKEVDMPEELQIHNTSTILNSYLEDLAEEIKGVQKFNTLKVEERSRNKNIMDAACVVCGKAEEVDSGMCERCLNKALKFLERKNG